MRVARLGLLFKDVFNKQRHGRRLRRTGGTVPPKFGPCIRPPIFGEVVLRDAREKYEVTKKCEMKEFLL